MDIALVKKPATFASAQAGPQQRPMEAQHLHNDEFWNADADPYPHHDQSDLVTLNQEVIVKEGPSPFLKIFLLATIIFVSAFCFYAKVTTGVWPYEDEIRTYFGLTAPQPVPQALLKKRPKVVSQQPVAPPSNADVGEPKEHPAVASAEEKNQPAEGSPANPYWLLPNKFEGPPRPVERPWTVAEEELLRSGLNNKFFYQHVKAIQDVRTGRLAGSEAILWDATKERKLWIRMNAIIGLAEFGQAVGIDVVEQAIGHARHDTVNRYFKRFVRGNLSEGERYILRSALRLLDPTGRKIILAALRQNPSELNALYLVASSFDPNRKIQRLAREAIADLGLPPAKLKAFKAQVVNERDVKPVPSEDRPPPASSKEAELPSLETLKSETNAVEFYQ